MEPITHFADRAEAVALSLSPTGVRPAAEAAMIRADAQITARIEELDAVVPNGDDAAALRRVGASWAAGKADAAEVVAAVSAPSRAPLLSISAGSRHINGGYRVSPSPSRLALIRAGAHDALVAKADKPAWQVGKLVESCRKGVAAWFDGVAEAATKALADLPEYARAHVAAGKDARSVGTFIDPLATPVAEVEALRAAAGPWTVINDADLTPVFAALATGRTMTATDRYGAVDLDLNMVNAAARELGMIDSRGMRAIPDGVFWTPAADVVAAGMPLDQAVLNGLAELSPLADPFGRDADELTERRALYARFHEHFAAMASEAARMHYLGAGGAGLESLGRSMREKHHFSDPARALAEFRGGAR